MANEITLKTRLLNFYEDSNTSTPRFNSDSTDEKIKLKKGEILFHEEMVVTDNGKVPVVLMKVGDGVTTNNKLNVVAARAADVYEWAKQATKPDYVASEIDYTKTTKEYNEDGEVISTKTEEITTQKAIDALYEAIATLSGDSGASIADLISRIGTIEADYLKATSLAPYATTEALNGKIAEVNGNLNKKVDQVADKSLVSDTEITKLTGVSAGANKVEKSSTNGSIKIDGQETVVYTHPNKHAIADVTGLQDALNDKQKAGNYSEVGHKHVKADITDFAHTHTASEITNLDATIKGYKYATKTELNDVDAKFADYVKSSDYATDKQGINEAIADRYTKAEADGKFALIADAYNDEEVRGLISANAGAIADIKGDYLKTADKTALENKITTNANAIERLTNGVSADEVDGVNDLIQYVKSHGTEVTGMQNNIQANADNIATINNNLKSAAYTESSAYATAAEGATANSALQTVKVLGQSLNKNSNELSVDQAKTALGLGSAAYTASTDYATAAQGLASVTTDEGIVATFSNNTLNIGLKDSSTGFTFILDANA